MNNFIIGNPTIDSLPNPNNQNFEKFKNTPIIIKNNPHNNNNIPFYFNLNELTKQIYPSLIKES